MRACLRASFESREGRVIVSWGRLIDWLIDWVIGWTCWLVGLLVCWSVCWLDFLSIERLPNVSLAVDAINVPLIQWLFDWSRDCYCSWSIDAIIGSYIDVDWLVDWSIGWLIGCLIHWLVGWSIGVLSAQTGLLSGWRIDKLTDWLIGWLIRWLIGRFDWLFHWLTDWSMDGSIGWLSDWLIDRLFGRLPGRLNLIDLSRFNRLFRIRREWMHYVRVQDEGTVHDFPWSQ